MQISRNAAESKSKVVRKNLRNISHYVPSGTSLRTETEEPQDKVNPAPERTHTISAGFLLLDTSLRPLYANQEALSALTYSGNLSMNSGTDSPLESRVQSLFEGSNGSRRLKGNGSLTSGKRCYQLRAFSVKSGPANGFKPAIAVLFERNKRASVDLSNLSGRFRLTQREVETVDHLVHGLNTQKMAERMGISPNTVKAFLRSIMMKMGADSRAGVIARILQG